MIHFLQMTTSQMKKWLKCNIANVVKPPISHSQMKTFLNEVITGGNIFQVEIQVTTFKEKFPD